MARLTRDGSNASNQSAGSGRARALFKASRLLCRQRGKSSNDQSSPQLPSPSSERCASSKKGTRNWTRERNSTERRKPSADLSDRSTHEPSDEKSESRERHACEFDEYFATTPRPLLTSSIYKDIAIALAGGATRQTSLLVLVKALAAKMSQATFLAFEHDLAKLARLRRLRLPEIGKRVLSSESSQRPCQTRLSHATQTGPLAGRLAILDALKQRRRNSKSTPGATVCDAAGGDPAGSDRSEALNSPPLACSDGVEVCSEIAGAPEAALRRAACHETAPAQVAMLPDSMEVLHRDTTDRKAGEPEMLASQHVHHESGADDGVYSEDDEGSGMHMGELSLVI
jgi:hypothetical protein